MHTHAPWLFPLIILSIVVVGVSILLTKKTDTAANFRDFAAQKRILHHAEVQTSAADLDGDGMPEEIVLRDGILQISRDNGQAKRVEEWHSPDVWWIDSYAVADANNDSITDINLSVWKSGDFGTSKPFWVNNNDMSIKNHFFVFDYVGETMQPVWQSSNLSSPNCEIMVTDIDSDGKNDLIALEGDYAQSPSCAGSYLAVWKWNGWGFSNEWRSERGDFDTIDSTRVVQMMRN